MTQTPDITQEAVERYDFFGHDTYSEINEAGEWVRASDYDALAARLAEVEAENADLREGLTTAYLAGSYDTKNKLKAAKEDR